jgi:sugar/nucleoside kinase (ribokinase family)
LIGTALVACARLGAECTVYTLLGSDDTGSRILRELEDEGVSTSGAVRIDGGGSPFSFIHVDEDSGDRTIFYRPGTNLQWNASGSLSEIKNAGALLVDDIFMDLSLAAAREARAHGVPVIADLTPSEENAELMRDVDILIAPQHFAGQLGLESNLDAALDAIHNLGPTTAVITLGSSGWVYSDPRGRGRGEAFIVEAVDTTGAGDTFHGAFAYGIARGWETAKCAEFASAVAAIKCTKPGGRTGLPSLSQTMEFLKQRGKNDWRSN